ncbi:hypothetical protein [Streptomyces sp. DHE17-7]|nr:hypothetical protein [Streptomyces sp. DHE17-7]
MAMGEEAELRVVLGDLCPLPPVLELLSAASFALAPEIYRLHSC